MGRESVKLFLNDYWCNFRTVRIYNPIISMLILLLFPPLVDGISSLACGLGMLVLIPGVIPVAGLIIVFIVSIILAPIDCIFFTKIYNARFNQKTRGNVLPARAKLKSFLALTWIIFFENITLFFLCYCLTMLHIPYSLKEIILFILLACTALIFPIWKGLFLSEKQHFFASLKQAIKQLFSNTRLIPYCLVAIIIRLILLVCISSSSFGYISFRSLFGYVILTMFFPLFYTLLISIQKKCM